jgi:glycosidase
MSGLTCVPGAPCTEDPCVYGRCRSAAGEAVCDCAVGYAGVTCSDCAPGYHAADLKCIGASLCDPDPCAHGRCSVERGVAVCTCESGYAGATCEECAPGYHERGLSCVSDVSGPCDPNPCTEAHRSVCALSGESFVCHCDPGTHDEQGVCVVDSVCVPNPCEAEHRHVCVSDGSGSHRCDCDAGYHDEHGTCVADTVCSPNPCMTVHETVCVPDGAGGHRCDCDPGYHDEHGTCVADGPCSPNPCVAANRTRCEVSGASHVCLCAWGTHDEGGTCVTDTVCDPASTCAGHGSCTGAGLACQCLTGYTGAHCADCSAGYHPVGSACALNTACDPNPCTIVHRTSCTPDGAGGHSCGCDAGYQDGVGDGICRPDCSTAGLSCGAHGHCALIGGVASCVCDTGHTGTGCATCATGYQDNDHNGTCRPTCALAGMSCGARTCSDSSGEPVCLAIRSCATNVSYDPAGQSITALYIRGELNSWGLQHPLTRGADGMWRASLDVAPGEYAYKLYDQGRDRWFEDPANPYFKWVSGQRNSRLRVPDCHRPLLALAATPVVGGNTISFQVEYVDGAELAGVDAATAQVTRNGTAVPGAFNPQTGLFTISDTGLANGKYAYSFTAADTGGRQADRLFVPVWIESAPFDWRDAVLYFAMTDRFKNGDASNDAPVGGLDVKANWQGGDFAGLKAVIDSGYFDALGVNAIWVSSPIQNTAAAWLGTDGDGRMYSGYHSYWPIATGWLPQSPLGGTALIDPHFGTLDAFKQMVGAAHARGIRILVDLVANHVHQESPLWSQHQGSSPPWFNLPTYVCGWDQPISCWFAPYLPDFHFETLPALEIVVEGAVWLAQECDLDGFRVDAVKHFITDVTYALRGRTTESVATSGSRFYMVGETFVGEGDSEKQLVKKYVGPAMLDGQFDFPLYWQVVTAFLREERDFRAIESFLQTNEGYYGAAAVMSNFLGNHDVPRALSHANGDIADMWGNGSKPQGWTNPPSLPTASEPYQRLRMAWTFLMTIRGIPLVLWGDEYGMEGAGDPDNRKMMRFGSDLNQLQSDTKDHVARLATARRAHRAFRYGVRSQLLMDQSNGLFWAYGMKDGGDVGVVVFNRNTSTQTRAVPVGGLDLGNGQVLRDVVHGTTATVANGSLSVTLGPHDSAVFVLP